MNKDKLTTEGETLTPDEEIIKDYPRLKLEYTRLHEDYRRLTQQPPKETITPLVDLAAIELEELGIRGDTMINTYDKEVGAFYLHDLMAVFAAKHVQPKEQGQKELLFGFAKFCSWNWTLSSDEEYWFHDNDDIPNKTTQQLYDAYIQDQLFVSED